MSTWEDNAINKKGIMNMRIRKIELCLFFMILVFAGCASYSPSMVKLDALGPNTVKQESGALCLYTEEYATKDKCATAFDTNLPDDGVLPLLVVLQNNGQQPYEIIPENIALRNGETTLRPLTSDEAASKARKNAFTRALGWSLIVPIISIPVVAVGSAMHTGKINQRMRQDFAAKSFAGGTIMPNKELSGFL